MKPIFATVRPDDSEREITQKDQFNTDEVTLAETLVRESLQNSIDARRPDQQRVRVVFRIVDPGESHRAFWSPLLGQLQPHLIACEIDTAGVDLGNPRILLVEDFGTTGLNGDYSRAGDSSFQDFWRRVGRSHKGGDKSGSWGLGKIVFPASSRIRTFFGLTVRHDDPALTPVLMGQTVLKYHTIEGRRFDPLGLFSLQIPLGQDFFRTPTTDPAYVAAFRAASGITRTSEPGLSIAIVCLRNEITSIDALVPFVVRNYFFPILTGRLEVEIAGVNVTAVTFDSLAASHGGAALADGHLVRFIREMHERRTLDPTITFPDSWSLEKLEEVLGPEKTGELQAAYSAGDLIHAKVPLTLQPRKGPREPGSFDIFLKKADPEIKVVPLFVRGAITIPAEASYFSSRQAFAALVASDGPVSRFLRDAENPAHTRWNGQAEKLSENWKAGSARLREIRGSLRALYDLLVKAADRTEPDALRDILSIPESGAEKSRVIRPPVVRRPVITPGPPSPKLFRVARTPSGFTVKAGAALEAHQLPLQIRVAAGYDVARGNPFRRHNKLDFDFQSGRIAVSSSGAAVTASSPNELAISAEAPDFEVRVNGFDTNRDLKLRVWR